MLLFLKHVNASRCTLNNLGDFTDQIDFLCCLTVGINDLFALGIPQKHLDILHASATIVGFFLNYRETVRDY